MGTKNKRSRAAEAGQRSDGTSLDPTSQPEADEASTGRNTGLAPLPGGGDEGGQMDKKGRDSEQSAINDGLDRDVRPLLDVVDRLRRHGVERDTSILQIAVFGDRSSGKSSVLEALSGIPFPRGSGLVTRCATRLTMKRVPGATKWSGRASLSWLAAQPSCAGAIPAREDVADAIKKLTAHVVQFTGGLSATTIVIECESAECPDLTIIDLPGIVRTTTAGHGMSDIALIDSLLDSYLCKERTIILAVTPGNVDIATVDILERANKHDPGGDRTITVMTKLDLVAPGSEEGVMEVLNNITKPTKLGWVAVRNRSQPEIDKCTSVAEARANERAFFANHPVFSRLSDRVVGVENLTRKLTSILATRIQSGLPCIYKELNQKLREARDALEALGEAPPSDVASMRRCFAASTYAFVRDLHATSEANYFSNMAERADVPSNDLRLYTRFKQAAKKFSTAARAMPPFDEDALAKTAAECEGKNLDCLPSFHVFRAEVKKFVDGWADLAFGLCEDAARSVNDCAELLARQHFDRYAGARAHVIIRCGAQIEERRLASVARIKALLAGERDPFTLDARLLTRIGDLRSEERTASSVGAGCVDEPNAAHREGNSYGWVTHAVVTAGARAAEANAVPVADLALALRGYYELAVSRFVDNVAMLLADELLTSVSSAIPATLLGENIADETLTTMYLAPSDVRPSRDALIAKVERLRAAAADLATAGVRKN